MEEGLKTWLPANVPLAGPRVYPQRLPQNVTLPAISYFQVSGYRFGSHSGFSGLARNRYQFNCTGSRYEDAKELAAQLKTVADGYAGLMGAVTVGSCLYAGERDTANPEVGRYTVMVDFMITYRA